ncbi:MAG TPA: MBL fold metallo-hydrolase, partial [Herpetosiphonaceae bacterium]|nr:MBL fold metallo-hydrolase [Herpetosiphonaceae bacterium]
MTFQHGQITDAISFVDNGLLGSSGVGTTYVVRGDEIVIVETGTSFCAPTIIEGLTALGVQPSDIRHILLTHIHMDHAGGAGLLVDAMPEAQIYIHSLTQQHLVDPERLISSAQRALGELFPAHGTIKPLVPEKLTSAEELDLDLGRGIRLHAISTPGHSPDHLSFYEAASGALFAGDAVGVVLPGFHYLGPVTPPPAVDVEAQHATFRRLLDLQIE